MNKIFVKIITCILIIFLLFNFTISPMLKINYVYAGRSALSTSDEEDNNAETADEIQAEVENSVAGVLNGIAGVLTIIPRAVAVVFGSLLQLETYSVLISGSTTASISDALISPFDIFFNKFALTNINIFQTNDVEEDSFVYSLRSNVAAVTLVMQIIAVVVLIIRFLIGLIKQFLYNTGSQKKEGKDLAEDSLVSFAMVIFIDLIMFAIISLNESFLQAWEGIAAGLDMSDLMSSLRSQILSSNYILATGCCIVFVILTVQTLKFAVMYIIRWIVVAVLIIIAPLTPIFYSHSQAKNGSSSVFNRWFRLFTSNVLIQSVHGILYIILVAIPLASLISSNSSVSTLDSLGASVVLVICIMYINKVEKMLRYIFGIENDVASFSMLNNSIHNLINRVSDVAIGGASMVSSLTTNNISTATSFGQDISNASQTTNNNVIHQFGERAGSMLGLGAGAGASAAAATANDEQTQNESVNGTKESSQTSESQEQADGENPAVVPVPPLNGQEEQSDSDIEEAARKELEEAVKQASEENKEESKTEQTSDQEEKTEEKDAEAELENMDLKPANGKELSEKYDDILNKIEDAKKAVDSLQADLEDLKEATEDNVKKLDKIGENVDDERASEIIDLVNKLVADNGIDYVKDNEQKIIGNNTLTNEEAEYMQQYMSNLRDEDEIKTTEEELEKNKRIMSKGTEMADSLATNAQNSGIISEATALALMANQDNVKGGGVNLSQAILTENVQNNENVTKNADGTTTTSKGEMETPNVGVDDSNEIPQDLIDTAIQTQFVQKMILENAEKIKVVGGEVTNDGKITGEAIARIMKGMSEGAYSQEKYNALKEMVKKAGEEHLLKQCESNFTAENAAKLTSDAGKQCVQFMAEQSIGTSIAVTSQLINMGATMSVASSMQGDIVNDRSSNVLNSLQGRKAAAGG